MEEFQIKIKYRDLSLGKHRIKLDDLAKSLSGYANVLGIVGTYITTGKFEDNQDKWSVCISTEAKINPGSIDIWAIISSVATSTSAIQPIVDTLNLSKSAFNAICNFLFSKREPMDKENAIRDIKDLVEEINKSKDNTTKMAIDLANHALDKMAEICKPHCKNAVHPIGKSCKEIDLMSPNENTNELDTIAKANQDVKNILCKAEQPIISEMKSFKVILCSLSKTNNQCSFMMAADCTSTNLYENTNDDAPKYKAYIKDDAFSVPSNVYTKSFDTGDVIEIQAKIRQTANSITFSIYDAKLYTKDDTSSKN